MGLLLCTQPYVLWEVSEDGEKFNSFQVFLTIPLQVPGFKMTQRSADVKVSEKLMNC